MNQIIIDNKHKIDTACQLCFYKLSDYNKAVEEFHQKRHEITNAVIYSQREQERQVNEAAETLSKAAQVCYDEIKHNLDTMRGAAAEMENLLDIGEDLQNALSVVKKLGQAMPRETRFGLVRQFKGQKQALLILKAAYEDAGLVAELYFEGLVFSADTYLDKLDDMAHRIVAQPGQDSLVVISFGTELEKFADSLGVELTKRFGDIAGTYAGLTDVLRSAAGLGTAD